MEQYKQLLEEIAIKTRSMTPGYIIILYTKLQEESNPMTADEWLRGFLLSVSTAQAWWGEGMRCNTCGGFTCLHHNDQVYEWQYHLQQCSLLETNEAILAYYDRHR